MIFRQPQQMIEAGAVRSATGIPLIVPDRLASLLRESANETRRTPGMLALELLEIVLTPVGGSNLVKSLLDDAAEGAR